MKRFVSLLLGLLLLLSVCTSCASGTQDDDGLTVVCTSFAPYDWARNVLGDTEGVNLILLADGGKDMHSYSPSAADIARIIKSDLLICTGGTSEAWVRELSEKNHLQNTLYLIDLLGDNAKHLDCTDEHHEGHSHDDIDEHVWLSLQNAMLFCTEIQNRLCAIDSTHADSYASNCESYLSELAALDSAFRAATSAAKHKTLVLADRYPFRYLFDDYGITCHAAFEGCSADSEVSFSTMIYLAQKVDELLLDSILITETSDGKLANTVKESTKQKNATILTLDSLQTVTDAGNESYLDRMKKNLEILSISLGA